MSKIFGGSKSKQTSTSSNRAYDSVNQAMSPLMGMAGTGANALQALLSGDMSGFNSFKDATGFDAVAEQGSRGITGNAAAKGMLRSGPTAKGLQAFGTNLQNTYANNYMDRLLQQAGLGFNAANSLTAAGGQNTSTGTSKSKPGLGGFIGGAMSGIAGG